VVEGSIADPAALGESFRLARPDYVVHAAASYKDPHNWEEDTRTNAEGTAAVVHASEAAGVKRLIYFQTALCYGLHPVEQPITLSHPLHPEGSSYAISKTAGEYYIALSGLDFISFRLANAYGPRNLSGPLPTFFHRLTAGKACFVMDTRRDFIYVDDLIDVVVRALDGAGQRGYYHVSSGRDYAIKELYDQTVAALQLKDLPPVDVRPRNPDDVFSILLDPSRTNQDFAWRTSTSLATGVQRATDYYREFGIQETYTHLKALSE
jgi:UDP-glucose 4-epimerase